MKAKQLEKLGLPRHLAKPAKWAIQIARQEGMSSDDAKAAISGMVQNPADYLQHPHFSDLAEELALHQRIAAEAAKPFTPRETPAPYHQWGDDLESSAVAQMHHACELPIAEAGALMPDAHLGYGLPIGGVLATKNAIIPYAVGVDIACRVKLSIFDLPAKAIESQTDRLIRAIEEETRFGMGAAFKHGDKPREHPVMDEDWSISPITQRFKDKAHTQLGTSGSGNHFVEFGTFEITPDHASTLDLQPGTYLALLSHSGSRGTGASVCEYYSNLAMTLRPNLPKQLKHLAWLDLDTHEGQEYFAAMNLMGQYASANHACIHQSITKHIGGKVLASVENHHNFAWQETHTINGQTDEYIVHRKGATPASENELGIIPGSMASPCYVVKGHGQAESLRSASHGAGRVMSRRKAKHTYRWAQVRPRLEEAGVNLLSAGLDENPFVYKNIDEVMAMQQDLVTPIATFHPKIVKMAPEGERAED